MHISQGLRLEPFRIQRELIPYAVQEDPFLSVFSSHDSLPHACSKSIESPGNNRDLWSALPDKLPLPKAPSRSLWIPLVGLFLHAPSLADALPACSRSVCSVGVLSACLSVSFCLWFPSLFHSYFLSLSSRSVCLSVYLSILLSNMSLFSIPQVLLLKLYVPACFDCIQRKHVAVYPGYVKSVFISCKVAIIKCFQKSQVHILMHSIAISLLITTVVVP